SHRQHRAGSLHTAKFVVRYDKTQNRPLLVRALPRMASARGAAVNSGEFILCRGVAQKRTSDQVVASDDPFVTFCNSQHQGFGIGIEHPFRQSASLVGALTPVLRVFYRGPYAIRHLNARAPPIITLLTSLCRDSGYSVLAASRS